VMESKQLEYKVRWRCSNPFVRRLERDEISFDACMLYYSCFFLGQPEKKCWGGCLFAGPK